MKTIHGHELPQYPELLQAVTAHSITKVAEAVDKLIRIKADIGTRLWCDHFLRWPGYYVSYTLEFKVMTTEPECLADVSVIKVTRYNDYTEYATAIEKRKHEKELRDNLNQN